jgi:hypothetical protein
VAGIVARAKHVAALALEQGTFTGEKMPTTGSCGDERTGSWIGWCLQIWDDGRWGIHPNGTPSPNPKRLMHVVLTKENVASVEALTRDLIASRVEKLRATTWAARNGLPYVLCDEIFGLTVEGVVDAALRARDLDERAAAAHAE